MPRLMRKRSRRWPSVINISTNGRDWKEVPTTGEFSNIMHNPVPQTVSFGNKVSARYIKLDATTPDATPARVDLKEIGIRLQK